AALEKNADAALKVLVDNATTEELATAVQNDPKLLEKLDKLEDKFVEQNNITVKQSVSTQAAKVVDEKKISVVGAGFNAKPGDTVRLNIAIPVKQEKVNTSIYPNAVQLDIKLVSDSGEIKNLKVPVTITMPVPQGVKKDNLAILHYKTDGSYDVLIPKQNADGTITFTVSHFSTFVFAQSASVTAPKTGEQIAWTIYGLAILGMIGAMVYVFTRKKE
ncbi:MAG: LPXTG cell wall anchor domain-containing protein, partial [Acetatifactor sp.]|nr:LPXTG cell wall anchor domain-containing protein [Acetatifactor sp.]